jgi:hypothetical protein
VVMADYVRYYMIPLLLDDLCDGDNCMAAAALVRRFFCYLVFLQLNVQVSSDTHLASRARQMDVDGEKQNSYIYFLLLKKWIIGSWPDAMEKVFWSLGLTMTASLIVACTGLLIVSLFVWKIWEFARFFCLFLGLVGKV